MKSVTKKQFIKKIASIVLATIIVFSAFPTVYASEYNILFDEYEEYGYSEKEISALAKRMEAYSKAKGDDEDVTENNTEIVANLYVVTRVKGTGHAWIYVENLTDETLKVGHYSLPPDEGVSVGLFSFTCEDGIGIYYNVEAYCCNVHGGEGLVSITTELDEDELNTLNNEILDYPNHWDPFFNCMYFAFSMWNSVSDRKLIALVLPIMGQLQLRIRGGEKDNLDMFCPAPEKVYRLKGKGSNATLVPVSAASIDQPIGG